MKTGIKSLELDDYNEIKYEVDQLAWFTREFRLIAPTARIDATDTIGHTHKTWEWARALKAIRDVFGKKLENDPYGRWCEDNIGIEILDVGSAYSLLGPALAYMGYCLTEAEVDTIC